VDQTIYESNSTRVARSEWQGRRVVTKTLKSGAQTPSAIARYQKEFDLNQSLTSPYICQALAYDETRHQIIFEDDDGVSLRDYLRNHEPSFDVRLHLAQCIAAAVQSILRVLPSSPRGGSASPSTGTPIG